MQNYIPLQQIDMAVIKFYDAGLFLVILFTHFMNLRAINCFFLQSFGLTFNIGKQKFNFATKENKHIFTYYNYHQH